MNVDIIELNIDKLSSGDVYKRQSFCNLIISGLMGVRPQEDGSIIINPLVPDEMCIRDSARADPNDAPIILIKRENSTI